MVINGYKAFHKGMKNRFDIEYKEHHVYTVDGPLTFGNTGNGIHFCKRLEDTLRYVPAMEEEVDIAKVTSLGEVVERDDEYNGYYDMYSARKLLIDRKLERDEIIEIFLNMPSHRVERFVQLFMLTKEEIELFKNRYANDKRVLNAIAYYQEGDTSIYERQYNKQYTKTLIMRDNTYDWNN